MASGTFVLFDHAKEYIGDGTIDLDGHSFMVAFVSAGFTPNLASHSVWTSDVSAYLCSASGYARSLLTSVTWSRVGSNKVRFTADNYVESASGTMNVKYVVLYDDFNDKLLGYFDTNTSDTSGVDATQITIQWGANGIFELS